MTRTIDQFVRDRRQEARIKFPVEILIYVSSEIGTQHVHKTTLFNISQEGISFELPISLGLKTRHDIEIKVSQGSRLQLEVKILWVKQLTDKAFLHGALLTRLSEEQINLLVDLMQTINRNQPNEKGERRAIDERRERQSAHDGPSKIRKLDRRLSKRYLERGAISSRPTKTITLRRVVITGIGVVAPNGIGKQEFLEALKTSKPGIKKISRFNPQPFPSMQAGEISDDEILKHLSSDLAKKVGCQNLNKSKLIKRTDRPVQFAIISAIQALDDADLDLSKINTRTVGISVGSIMGGLAVAFREHDKYVSSGMNHMNPYTVAAASPNPCSGELAAELKLKGPSATFSQGCTSGAMAISYAFDQIQQGKAMLMIAGGADSPLIESTYAAFCRSGMLAPSNGVITTPQPMDRDRTGMVLSEGAGMVILEDLDHALARGAPIYAEIMASSNTCDGHDMIRWRWHGAEATRAMRMALAEAGIEPMDVSVVFAQATGSIEGDNMELQALHNVFGRQVQPAVTNVKGMIGYSQAACAPIELVAACLALENNFIPALPQFNAAEKLIHASSVVRTQKLQNALINCFGFGGKNVCLMISKI